MTDEQRRRIEWDLQPAEEPFDLSVTPEEREELVYQIKWFSRFSVSEKFAIAARHRRLAERLRAIGAAHGPR
ncbi:MAG: hypothetical protein HY907_01270 [Deltaproteobacteria bacterium]|nr:hypothetical protein [Deltaproteobacteria bacterium]